MSATLRPPNQRRINGELLDVRNTAALLGVSEKALRKQIERRLFPFRRLGGRVVFLRAEVLDYIRRLDGCALAEALQNATARRGR